MKKIILSAVVAAAAIFGAYSASQNSNEVAMNDLQMENIEALAGAGENPYGSNCRWDSVKQDCTHSGNGSTCVGVDSDCQGVVVTNR